MASLQYTETARNDMLEAWQFIARDTPDAADRVLDTIDQEARQLAENPLLGRQRTELKASIRSWPTRTPFIIFYQPANTGIMVLRVLHHARDLANIDSWT